MEPHVITIGSLRWTVQPAWRDLLLGPGGLRFDDWLSAGQAQVVKKGPHRIVYRVSSIAADDIYIKHNRVWNLRAWFRELIRPPKARIEFERARAVAACGIDTIEPIALGETIGLTPAESFLITRGLPDTCQLDRFLQEKLPTLATPRQIRLRQALARALADFIRRLHDQGVVHHDLHPGNILIRLEADDLPRFFLIDLHAATIEPPLGPRARSANLVLLNQWFALQASRSDRLRFWRAYFGPTRPTQEAAELERHTLRAQLRFWNARESRCLGSNRYFQRLRRPGVTGVAVRDIDPQLLERLLADPDAPFTANGAILVKDSRSSTVAELPGGLIYKRFRQSSWHDRCLALLRPTPALRSWTQGHGLRERGLPTPRPLAVIHRQRHGLTAEGYLLTEKIDQAVNLHAFISNPRHQQSAHRDLIDRLARLLHELHRRGVSHRDLKASNILVRGQESGVRSQESGTQVSTHSPLATHHSPLTTHQIWLIDLVGARRRGTVGRSRRVQNLARLTASFLHSPRVTRTDRLRFLLVYLRSGLRGRAGWKRWWKQIEAATLAKVERNRRHGRVLG